MENDSVENGTFSLKLHLRLTKRVVLVSVVLDVTMAGTSVLLALLSILLLFNISYCQLLLEPETGSSHILPNMN